jgi:hypothetical protein
LAPTGITPLELFDDAAGVIAFAGTFFCLAALRPTFLLAGGFTEATCADKRGLMGTICTNGEEFGGTLPLTPFDVALPELFLLKGILSEELISG